MSLPSNTGRNTTSTIKNAPGFIPDIIGFNKWPSATAKYHFKNIGNVPQLRVVFAFDISRYTQLPDATPADDTDDTEIPQWKQNAIEDLAVYKSIRYQLKWMYAPDDDKPTEKVRATDLSAFISLTPAAYKFTSQQTANTLAFINNIINWLQSVTTAPEGGRVVKVPVNKTLIFPLTGTINPKNIFEVEVIFAITRADANGGTNATVSSTAVMPDISAGLTAFSKRFENIFKADDHRLKLATGASLAGSNSARQLWAVRLANSNTGKGIFYIISAGTATAIAPVPLSTNLITSGSTAIRQYKTRAGIDWDTPPDHMQFNSIDLDAWMKVFLQAIDDLFATDNIGAVMTCASLYKLQHPDNADLIQDIAAAKTSITGQLVKLLEPVIAGQIPNLNHAAGYLAQQLNNRLYNFYSTTAVVQYSVTAANTDTGVVKLSGDIGTLTANNQKLKGVNVSGAILTIDTGTEAQSGLSFGISLIDPGLQTHLAFSTTFRPTQVEYTPEGGINIILNILQPETSPAFSANVPIVIREHPVLPTLISQTAAKTHKGDAVSIPQTVLWNYSCKYQNTKAAQDMFQSQLLINEQGAPVGAAYDDASALFANLAQFIMTYPPIKTDLDDALPQINNSTTGDSDNYKTALYALISLSQLIVKVKNALKTGAPGSLAAVAAGFNKLFNFTISETTVNTNGDNRLLVNVSTEKTTGKPIELPEVIIQGYDTVPLEALSGDTKDIKRYTYSRNGKSLMFANAFKPNRIRAVKFKALNALEVQSIRTLNGMWRNKALLPNAEGGFFETNDKFVYHISQTASTQNLAPKLNWADTGLDLASLATKGKLSVKDHLAQFFGAITKGVENVTYWVKLQIDYQYKVNDDEYSPLMTMPLALVPSTAFNTSDDTELRNITDGIDKTIKQWSKNAEITGYSQRYNFVVTIFSTAEGTGNPLYFADNLYLNLNDIG
ncbi:hypothetical protein EWM62_03420 [Mucilaginibacter terrigena]|uniref:Uncharacterized protein n=1 Tax=Mucilaginibacter terrigena TaxID=2492395 RepID=A0A4Q5LSL9_9SPHI|nr:hypothetical protein [Mucilaginibacter terrigena]RYU92495.1 hypothetical protein EWM62_03420 [Mucilaginibacter terrigena]